MRAWVAIVLAAAAACAAPQKPERLKRPRPADPGPPHTVLTRPRPGLELVTRDPMPTPRDIGPVQLSTMRPALPPAPRVTPLARPRSGGDALRLADRALELGDALDAAAQYRPLLARARHADAHYIQLQLARALLALGQRSEATALLWSVAASRGPEAWPALLLLADVRSQEAGVARSLAELRSIAGERLTLIEAHLIHVAGPSDAAALLLSAAERTEMQGVACGYTLAALERIGVDRLPGAVRHGRCGNEIDAYLGLAPSGDFLVEEAVATWDRARELVDMGRPDPDAWLDAARAYVVMRRRVHTDQEHLSMAYNAYNAWLNAVIVAMHNGPISDAFLAESGVLLEDLGPIYHDDARRVLDGLTAHARTAGR